MSLMRPILLNYRGGFKTKNTSDLMFTGVVYMFPIYSGKVDFDEDTFDGIDF